jgi:hypothetical protein
MDKPKMLISATTRKKKDDDDTLVVAMRMRHGVHAYLYSRLAFWDY